MLLRRAASSSSSAGERVKTVVITGASSGIGEEVAKIYASQGVHLFLSARRVEKLAAVKDACLQESKGATEGSARKGSVSVISCDVAKEASCKALIDEVLRSTGAIDILVLNAGVGQTFFLEAMKEDVDYKQFMNVNYYGCLFPTLAALPHLSKTSGSIVVVSSLGGLIPYPRQTFYNASKFALVGFFETLRMELNMKKRPKGQDPVSITMVCPGFVETELTKGAGIGKDGKPFGSASEDSSKAATSRPGMMSARKCAEDIVRATELKKKLLITPRWYWPIYVLRTMFPTIMDKVISKTA